LRRLGSLALGYLSANGSSDREAHRHCDSHRRAIQAADEIAACCASPPATFYAHISSSRSQHNSKPSSSHLGVMRRGIPNAALARYGHSHARRIWGFLVVGFCEPRSLITAKGEGEERGRRVLLCGMVGVGCETAERRGTLGERREVSGLQHSSDNNQRSGKVRLVGAIRPADAIFVEHDRCLGLLTDAVLPVQNRLGHSVL